MLKSILCQRTSKSCLQRHYTLKPIQVENVKLCSLLSSCGIMSSHTWSLRFGRRRTLNVKQYMFPQRPLSLTAHPDGQNCILPLRLAGADQKGLRWGWLATLDEDSRMNDDGIQHSVDRSAPKLAAHVKSSRYCHVQPHPFRRRRCVFARLDYCCSAKLASGDGDPKHRLNMCRWKQLR